MVGNGSSESSPRDVLKVLPMELQMYQWKVMDVTAAVQFNSCT